jgi:hypothetical protein
MMKLDGERAQCIRIDGCCGSDVEVPDAYSPSGISDL